MKYRDVAIISFCVSFSLICLTWTILWMVMAKDLTEKVDALEKEVCVSFFDNNK